LARALEKIDRLQSDWLKRVFLHGGTSAVCGINYKTE
jgi:hypothetical protein